MSRLTLVEIGKLAGVSRSTVSRVINNHPNISPDVRERVQRIIAETGYQPNSAARSLASKQSRVLGLVIPSVLSTAFSDPYYSRLIQGISHACNENDYTISLYLFQTDEEEQRMVERIASRQMVDGLIITSDSSRNSIIPLFQQYDIPFVQIGRPCDDDGENISYVDVDNLAGGYLATSHLIRLGRKRIAHISTVKNSAGFDREAGYRRALKERGVQIDEALIEVAEFNEDSAYHAMKKLLAHAPDAVFIQSDTMSRGAIRAIQNAGLRIPEDVALVSFDDLPFAMSFDIPLTTIRQPIFRMGGVAIDTLIDLIKTSLTPARHIVLPVELVIRTSCGAVN